MLRWLKTRRATSRGNFTSKKGTVLISSCRGHGNQHCMISLCLPHWSLYGTPYPYHTGHCMVPSTPTTLVTVWYPLPLPHWSLSLPYQVSQ